MSHTGPATAIGENAIANSGVVFAKKLVYRVAPKDISARLKDFKLQVEKRLLENPRSYFVKSTNIIDLDFEDASGVKHSSTLVTYFNSLPSHQSRLVILGGPGSGKTTAAFQLMSHLLSEWEDGSPVPVRVPLPTWNTKRKLLDWLTDHLTEHKFTSSRDSARELLEHRLILPIFDGLDEMDSSNTPVRATRALQALKRLNGEYDDLMGKARLVVVCRTERYDTLVRRARLENAATVTLQPLKSDQQLGFLRDSGLQDAVGHWLPEWQCIAEELTWSGAPQGLARVLNTPWRLALLVTGYKKEDASYRPFRSPDALLSMPTHEVPKHLLSLYTGAATELRNSQKRINGKRNRRYDAEKVEEWLGLLAQGLVKISKQSTSERRPSSEVISDTDIVLHRLWLLEREATGRQEVALWFIVAAITLGLAHRVGLDPNGVSAVLCLAILWLGMRWVLRQQAGQPVPMRINFRQLASQRFIGSFAVLNTGTAVLVFYEPRVSPALSVLTYFGYLAGTLLISSWRPVPDYPQAALTGPRDPLRAELRYGLISAVAAAASIGALITQVRQSGWGFLYGALLAPLPVSAMSALAWRRYFAFRLVMSGKLPWRLGPFLDWCCGAGLLRAEGFAYQFRHRELQDWLADHGIKPEKNVLRDAP